MMVSGSQSYHFSEHSQDSFVSGDESEAASEDTNISCRSVSKAISVEHLIPSTYASFEPDSFLGSVYLERSRSLKLTTPPGLQMRRTFISCVFFSLFVFERDLLTGVEGSSCCSSL